MTLKLGNINLACSYEPLMVIKKHYNNREMLDRFRGFEEEKVTISY